jgi:hypothetical protein
LPEAVVAPVCAAGDHVVETGIPDATSAFVIMCFMISSPIFPHTFIISAFTSGDASEKARSLPAFEQLIDALLKEKGLLIKLENI